MKAHEKIVVGLNDRFEKVSQTPASFALYAAIHDFIEYIEVNPALSGALSDRIKINRDLNIPVKYSYLKQIYQGVEDANARSTKDLGHERYSVLRDLNRIQNNDVSDSISFWKKRETYRKLTGEVHERLHSHLSKSKTEKK